MLCINVIFNIIYKIKFGYLIKYRNFVLLNN